MMKFILSTLALIALCFNILSPAQAAGISVNTDNFQLQVDQNGVNFNQNLARFDDDDDDDDDDDYDDDYDYDDDDDDDD